MKTPLAQIQERRGRLASVLRREGYVSVADLARRLDVSEATIRRDLVALERENRITRTYGGALSEYDALFMPFYQRNMQNREKKRTVACLAADELKPGQTVFLDAGSTVYGLAERLAEQEMRSLEVVTSSLPVAEVLASHEFEKVHLLGGRLLPHQLIVVGPGVSLSLSAWRFDQAFLSAEGADDVGLWNSQDEISDFQRHVCGRSERTVFCVDSTKLGRAAPSFLLPWSQVGLLITDDGSKGWEPMLGLGVRVLWASSQELDSRESGDGTGKS